MEIYELEERCQTAEGVAFVLDLSEQKRAEA